MYFGVGHCADARIRVPFVRPSVLTLERSLAPSMIRDIIRRSEELRAGAARHRTMRVVVVITSATVFVLAFAYHLIAWSRGTEPEPGLQYAYRVLVLIGGAAFWALLAHALRKREPNPARSYWSSVLGGILVLIIGRVIVGMGGRLTFPGMSDPQPLGFELNTGVPLTLLTVIKMNTVSVLLVTLAFVLLLRMRDLVLFKRTTSSQRNWYLMLGMMSLASVATIGNPPNSGYGVVALIGIIGAIGFMVVNALRLSWIIFLSMRQKILLAGLSLLLVITLASLGLTSGDGPGLLTAGHAYLEHYSYAMATFVTLSLVFGILYGTTSFLSLLFHLPTTTDIQQKVGELAAMHSLTALVNQVFDTQRLLQMIAASPVEAGSAHRAWLAVTDRSTGMLRAEIAATVNVTEEEIESWLDVQALYEDVNETRGLLQFEQALADRRVRARPGDGIGSLLVVPLLARDRLLGALFASKPVTFGFEKDDVEAIGVFASQAALALDHARLYEEQLEKERLARELDIARAVQQRLLPQHVPTMPGTSIAATSIPALEVGGDYYDFLQLDEDRLAFIIADVAGKGTSAAFYMAEMQGIFQSVSRISSSPTEFLIHANHALAPSLEKQTFISVVYGVLDTRAEQVTLARAGHCPPALINLHGETRLVRSRGLGLGLDRSDRFGKLLCEERIPLRPGDVLALYTDGLVETRDPSGEEYGYDRLTDMLRRHRHEDVDDLHRTIVQDLKSFSSDGLYDDDMTLVLLKWQGIMSPSRRSVPSIQELTVER